MLIIPFFFIGSFKGVLQFNSIQFKLSGAMLPTKFEQTISYMQYVCFFTSYFHGAY